MKDIRKIPPQWLEALQRLKEAGFKAVLAGGALRDLYCGRTPKDIDIFILHANSFGDPFKIARIVDNERLWSTTQYKQITSHAQIDYVVRLSKVDEDRLPFFELIGMIGFKSGEELIKRFDFGLNQIAVEDGQIIFTDDFRYDFMHETFTMTHAYTYERSLDRYKMFQTKYPNWPLKKKGIVVLHEYYKSYEHGSTKAPEHPLEPA